MYGSSKLVSQCEMYIIHQHYTPSTLDIEMSMLDKSSEVSKYIQILEQAELSLKSLQSMLPSSYNKSIARLLTQVKHLIEKSGELSAFLSSIEEIRNDVCSILSVKILFLTSFQYQWGNSNLG